MLQKTWNTCVIPFMIFSQIHIFFVSKFDDFVVFGTSLNLSKMSSLMVGEFLDRFKTQWKKLLGRAWENAMLCLRQRALSAYDVNMHKKSSKKISNKRFTWSHAVAAFLHPEWNSDVKESLFLVFLVRPILLLIVGVLCQLFFNRFIECSHLGVNNTHSWLI